MNSGLDFGRAPDCLERAHELDQKGIANYLDLSAFVLPQNRPDQPPLFLKELHCKRFIPLRERGETDHVGEHDRSEPSLAIQQIGFIHYLS
jgi:hypothetical protein